MKSLTEKLHSWFIPVSYFADELNFRKARIYINSTLLTTLFAAFFLLNTLAFEMHYHLYSMVVCTFGFFLLTFFLKWGISLEVATHFFVGIAVTATVWNAWFLGGLQSYNLPWICFAPVLAILFGNPKIGWIWLGVSITALLVISAFQLTGYEFKTVINPRFIHILGSNSHMALVLVLFFIVLITEQAYTNTMIKLNMKNRIIEESFSELKSTQAQLIQSEKMASLGELTAGVAHEIQNPLNFVNNFSEINKELLTELLEDINDGKFNSVKEIVNDLIQNEEKITQHGKRAEAIVKGMLQHSRTKSDQKEKIDINALCDEYLKLAYHGLRAKDKSFNSAMDTNYSTELPEIEIARQDLGRVILNVITNAFHSVRQKSENNPDNYQPTIGISTIKNDNNIEISISDNGVGIPDDIKNKIFQPFFTTKPTGQGTGLGLSMSYDIIKMHGGHIEIDSTEGEGATFIIRLPIDN